MEAPWNHPTRTHMAPLCHLDRALPLERLRFHDDGTMRALGLHHRNTLATRIRHRDSTVPGRKEPQRIPVPNPIRPILCAGWPSTKNGAAGSDFGRNRARRHPGDKTTHSCVQGNDSICGHLPHRRHSRSCGLMYRRHLGANPPLLTNPCDREDLSPPIASHSENPHDPEYSLPNTRTRLGIL